MTENNNRRIEDAPLQRNLASFRTVLELLVVAGICWLVAQTNQQSKDIIEIKTSNQYIKDTASAVPVVQINQAKIMQELDNHEKRIGDLETLQKVK